MAKLTKEMIDFLEKTMENVEYGSITLHLIEHSNAIDIEVTERKRMNKNKEEIAPGTVVVKKVIRND